MSAGVRLLLVVFFFSLYYSSEGVEKFIVRAKRQQCSCIVIPLSLQQIQCSCDRPPATAEAPQQQAQVQQQQELQQQLQQMQSVKTSRCSCALVVVTTIAIQAPQYQCQCTEGIIQLPNTTTYYPTYQTYTPTQYPVTAPTVTVPPYTQPPETQPPATLPPATVVPVVSQTYPPQTPQTMPPETVSPQTPSPETPSPQTVPPPTQPPTVQTPLTQPPQTLPPMTVVPVVSQTYPPATGITFPPASNPPSTGQQPASPCQCILIAILGMPQYQCNCIETTTTVSPTPSTTSIYSAQNQPLNGPLMAQQDAMQQQYQVPTSQNGELPAISTCLYYVVQTCVCAPQYVQCGENMCCLQARYRSHKVVKNEDKSAGNQVQEDEEPSTMDLFLNVLQKIKTNLQKVAERGSQ